jgi:hypothetical protein
MAENTAYSTSVRARLPQYLLNPSDQAARQADLDTMRVGGRFGQDALDNAIRQFSGKLVLFQNDADFQARLDVATNGTVHLSYLSVAKSYHRCRDNRAVWGEAEELICKNKIFHAIINSCQP